MKKLCQVVKIRHDYVLLRLRLRLRFTKFKG